MAKFKYKAYNKEGVLKEGEIEANTKEKAVNLLRDLNLTVTSLEEQGKGFDFNISEHLSFLQKVKTKDVVIFSRQLATMINSGLPLVQAIRILEEQTQNKTFKEVLDGIASDVEAGEALSHTLTKYPKVFNKVYVSLIKSGEASGKLDTVLLRLADQLEKDYAMVSKIKSAMYYPAFILVALFGVGGLMVFFVMPQLSKLFKESNVELPIATQLLLGLSDFLQAYWWLVIIILVGAIFGFRFWIGTPQGRLVWDKIKLKIPVFGGLARKIYVARFTRTLGTLIGGGLPILDSLHITGDAVGNMVFKDGIDEVAKKVETGMSMGTVLRKNPEFPVMVSQMIEVGEKTGNVDEILERLADFFESEVDALVAGLSSLLEPILMVVMGIGVAILALAVIMPIYNLASVI